MSLRRKFIYCTNGKEENYGKGTIFSALHNPCLWLVDLFSTLDLCGNCGLCWFSLAHLARLHLSHLEDICMEQPGLSRHHSTTVVLVSNFGSDFSGVPTSVTSMRTESTSHFSTSELFHKLGDLFPLSVILLRARQRKEGLSIFDCFSLFPLF